VKPTLEKELLVYIDGRFVPQSEAKVSVFDHGFLYGDGVFEGIRVYNGIVFKLKEHIDRLYASAHYIQLKIPISKEEMIKAVVETLKVNNLRDGYIRLVVTRGIGDLGLDPRKCPNPSIIIITQPVPPYHGAEAKTKGIEVIIASIRRDPVDATSHEIKSLNYLNSILAKIEAANAGVPEAIILDTRGFVSEATGENVFVVKNGKVYTTPASAAILKGITRDRVIQLLNSMGIDVIEKDITPFELVNADEVFLTGTMAEVIPVVKINGREIGSGKVGSLTKKLIEEFTKITKDPSEGVPID
jgi:branched-chain amino acid aminotransferase